MFDYITWDSLQAFNFVLAITTGVLCFIVGAAMVWWTWRLRNSKSFFKGWFITLAPIEFSLSWWAFGNAYSMWYAYDYPPNPTLIPRVLIVCSVFAQIIYVAREARRARVKEANFILIVENNETLARIYRNLLQEADYRAEFATSGYDTLTLQNYQRIDMVLVDIGLGDMTGVELIRKMRENGFAGKAIAVSGSTVGLDGDFVEVLLKPVMGDELIAAIRRHLV